MPATTETASPIMPRTAIGIDIGSSEIRAVEATLGKKPAVRRAHRTALPHGAVTNGVVTDKHAFTVALAELWQSGGFKSKTVNLGIGSSATIIREHSVPAGTLADIRASLPLYVDGALPFDASDAVLDFYSGSDTTAGARTTGLLVAATLADVESTLEGIQLRGVEVNAIDAVPFASWRSIGDAAPAATLIDFGASSTTLVFAADGSPEFVRVLPFGGDDLTDALERDLPFDRPQCEKLKRRAHLSRPGSASADQTAQLILRTAAREVLTGIRDTLQFVDASRSRLSPSVLHVTGGASRLGGLLDALGEMTGVRVSPVRDFQGIAVPDKLPDITEHAREYAAAVGLAARGAQA